jgi:alpha/beta superfamily hydrolase
MKVLFLHGFGSRPGGLKPAFLREHGHEVINPGLPDNDFGESVRIAQEAFDQSRPEVVVGSSRGGAVAMNLHTGRVPLVLIAPAWRKWGAATTIEADAVILHSEHDDMVPIHDSRELLRQSRLDEDHLIVVGQDHRMADQEAFAALLESIRRVAGQGSARPEPP